MAKPKLNGTTIVRDRGGRAHAFGPSDTVPEWAWSRIGAHLWEVAPEGAEPEAEPGDASGQSGADDDGGEQGGEPQGSTLKPPPIAGAGSGTEPWREYAIAAVKERGLNIEISADAGKKDILAALEEVGIPTKE